MLPTRDAYRLQPKYFNGFRRTNFSLDRTSMDPGTIVYKITPCSVGKLISPFEKVKVIIGQIFTKNNSSNEYEINPLFNLSVKLFALYQSMTYKSDIKTVRELIVNSVPIDKKAESQIIKVQVNKLLEDKQLQSKMKQLMENLQDLLYKGTRGRPRVQTLKKYHQMVEQQSKDLIQKTQQFLIRNQKPVLSQELIQQQIQAVKTIEYLTVKQQQEKVKIMLKKYKKLLAADLQGYTSVRDIKLRRPSSESQPVIQRLSEYIGLRKENGQYKAESEVLIRQIYDQMLRYSQLVVEDYQVKSRFTYLNPDTIVVDQFNLKPTIYYEPILKQALGLKYNPMSIESVIAFQPTPKGFDYFRAPIQLQKEWQIKMKDPLYGCLELYENYQKFDEHIENEINREKQDLIKEKEQIVTWRFLLLAYYVANTAQFGRLYGSVSWQESEKYFKKKVNQKQKQLQQNYQNLIFFLEAAMISSDRDQKCIQQEKQESAFNFSFKFEQFYKYLAFSKDDQMVQAHHLQKTHRYFKLRWNLVWELLTFLAYPKECFQLMMNSKKYYINYMVMAIESFEEARRMAQSELDKEGERSKLRNTKTSAAEKVRVDKEGNDPINVNYDSVKKYLNKDVQNKHYKYLTYKGKYLIQYLDGFQQKYKELINLTKILNDHEKFEKTKTKQYKQNLNTILKLSSQTIADMKTLLIEITYCQIHLKPVEKLHKFHKNSPLNIQKWNYVTKKYMLTLFTYLTLTQQTFSIYDSLIVPLLSLNMNVVQYKFNERQLKNRTEDLGAIQDVIEFSNLLPKKLVKLRH